MSPSLTESKGLYAVIIYLSSTGSAPVPVACISNSPSVSLSSASPAIAYHPFAISETAPEGEPKAPPFLLIVTVGDNPVTGVTWSVLDTIRKHVGYDVLFCSRSFIFYPINCLDLDMPPLPPELASMPSIKRVIPALSVVLSVHA